jgi:hypothetical protein
MKSTVHNRFFKLAVVAIVAKAILVNPTLVDRALAGSASPHHSFLGGPWEIIVKTRLDEEGLRFPLNVSDETKPQKLHNVLPIKGTPIEIELENYVPDLKWETNAVKVPGGEIAVKLLITGRNLKQDIWLSSGDPTKQSISSSIGGITIKRLHDIDNTETLIQELTDSRAVGILSIWPEDSNQLFECVAKTAEIINVPKSEYRVSIVKYIPHYSIDKESKKVINQSQKPINPAVKVIIENDRKTFERWLWAKFLSSPHGEAELPLRIRFTDFDLRKVKGQYILAVSSGTKLWLFLSKKGEKRVERAILGRSYPFADKEYSFCIEEIIDGAIVKTSWTNGSQRLLRPAVIVTIKQNGTRRKAVLELNKPIHHRIESGMLVLLYRRRLATLR